VEVPGKRRKRKAARVFDNEMAKDGKETDSLGSGVGNQADFADWQRKRLVRPRRSSTQLSEQRKA